MDYEKLLGKRFGNLIIQELYKDEKGYWKAKCQCDCGNDTIVFLTNILYGRTKSCGCMEGENRRKHRDITGQRFGMLMVIEPTEERDHGNIIWKCKCDCGEICYKPGNNLIRGYTWNCGCTRKRELNSSFIDLKGKRFGKLKVLSKTSNRTNKGSVIWHCQCDCGVEKDYSEDELVHGHRISCGCRRGEVGQELFARQQRIDGTCIEALNRKIRVDNKTGVKGVSITKNSKYIATIGFKGRRYSLGRYDSLMDAVKVRKQAEERIHNDFKRDYMEWKEIVVHNPSWANIHPFIFDVVRADSSGIQINKQK